VEYLYVDFGSVSTTASVNNDGLFAFNNLFLTQADLKAHIARAGINYRFWRRGASADVEDPQQITDNIVRVGLNYQIALICQ
jgi:hypothetical protein